MNSPDKFLAHRGIEKLGPFVCVKVRAVVRSRFHPRYRRPVGNPCYHGFISVKRVDVRAVFYGELFRLLRLFRRKCANCGD